MEPRDHRDRFFASQLGQARAALGKLLRAIIRLLPSEPPVRAPDGLRGLPEIFHGMGYGLRLKLQEVPGWFRPAVAASGTAERPLESASEDAAPTPATRCPWLWTRRTLSVALGAAAVMFAWAGLLAWLDPFGLNRNTGQYSEHLNARLEAPFYDSRAQGDIVMVLITPETLKDRGYGWPPRYEYYADAVRRILYDSPRAVFVDVLVRRERQEDNTLEYARGELDVLTRETRIPVLLGTERPGAPSLFSEAHGVDVAPIAWMGAGSDYPLRLTDANIVPWSHADAPETLTDSQRESVALRLYRFACPGMLDDGVAVDPKLDRLPGCNPSRNPWTLPANPAPMVVQWGQQRPWPWRDQPGRTEDLQALAPTNACFAEAPDPGRAWRWARTGGALVSGLFSGLNPAAIETSRERCPYTLTVAEHQVEDLPEGFLKDRIVILAVDLPGVEDSVLTPVHRRVPGGYLHAMALDNLMDRGGDYRYRDEGMSRVVSSLAGLSLCLALALILRGHRRGLPIVRWALLSLAGFTVGLATWWSLTALSLPAPNWVVAALLFAYTAWRVTARMRAPTPSQRGVQP